MVDHYCVAPWRMEQLESAEKERDEMRDEIKRLRAENTELRKWLDGSQLIIANMMPKEVGNATV